MLRVLLALLAAAACAWFVVGIRQARDVSRATTLLGSGGHVDGATGARIASLLNGAALLNPDREVDLLRAQLADERGQRARAQRILRRVVAAEPRNALAWVQLARSATNGATLALAYHHIEALVPAVH